MIKLFKILNSKKGFSMTELLTVIVILSLLTVAVAVMVSASATTYKNSLMISESATVENMINTALSEELRYADFVKTDGEENVQGINRVEVNKIAYSISLDGNGRLIKKNNNSNTTVALLNRGSYANLHVEDFSISYNNSVFTCTYKLADKNSSYVSDPIVYTVKSAVFQPERDAESGVVLPSPNITPPPAPGTEDFHKIHIVFMVSDSDGVRTVGDILETVPDKSEYYVTFNPDSPEFNSAYAIAGYDDYSPDEINIPSVKYDRTIVVNCKPVEYRVYYNFGDDETGVHPGVNYDKFTVEYKSVVLNPPTKDGASFTGWTCPELGVNEPKIDLVLDTTVLKERTYYAHWGDAQFTIRFDGNDATSGTMADQVFTYGTPQTLTLNAFQKTNYSFAGWSDTKGGPVQYTDGQEGSTIVNVDGSTKTLYAVWPYKVHFNKNASDATGSMADQTLYYNGTDRLTANGFTRPGYLFNGWYTGSDGSGTGYIDNATVTNIPGVANGNVTLYAKWDAKNITITFNPGDGRLKNEYSNTTTQRTVAYDSTYSTGTYTRNGTTYRGVPQVNDRSGYRFLGWYTAQNGGERIIAPDSAGTEICKLTQNTTLYARWARLYTVDFRRNYSPDSTISSVKLATGDAYGLNGPLPTPTRSGYRLAGWFTDQTNGTQIFADTIFNGTADQRVYAHWKKECTVTFNPNGGNTPSPSTKVLVDGEQYGTLPTTSRTGYTFDGWYSSASGGNRITTTSTFSGTNNITVYAHWTPIKYTITWKNYDGSVLKTDQVPFDSTPVYDGITPSKPEDDSYVYKFNGWAPAISSVSGDAVYTAQLMPVGKYTLSLIIRSQTELTVTRTSSPNAGASIGQLSSGARIYAGDVLSIYAHSNNTWRAIGLRGTVSHSPSLARWTYETSHTVAGNVNLETYFSSD